MQTDGKKIKCANKNNIFLKEYPNKGIKKIAVFTCFMGSGANKAIEKLKQYLGISKFEAKLVLIDPKDKNHMEKIKNRRVLRKVKI